MHDHPAFHSRFGGLWIDRADWRQQVTARHLNPAQAAQVEFFAENGFIIFEGAAAPEKVDAFRDRIMTSFREGNPDVRYQRHGSHVVQPLDGPADRLGVRIVDSFVPFQEALDLFSSPELLAFFQLIFDANPLLFQSLSFDQGSQQGLHQDTAYVVVDRPIELAACWIALEDVKPGAGELMYVPGSHRLPDWDFGSGNKHWDSMTDGAETHEKWARHLVQHAKQSPHGLQYFFPKKGDILVWHADLAHGGAPVIDPARTRQSLVGHFCPQGRTPHFFNTDPHLSTVRHHGPLAYCSQHYDLSRQARARAGRTPGSQRKQDGFLSSLAAFRNAMRNRSS
ncbi:MAG: hypothetical protein COC10_05080 [Sphingobium sp.]|nr:MAG: hypothetical protein COC10_05080 [Sphingobium sp.]